MNPLYLALKRLSEHLDQLDMNWALIGGLAVSVRGEPRTTRDVDSAVVVQDDRSAENLIRTLFHNYGYSPHEDPQLERKDQERLAGMRLLSPQLPDSERVIVDLLFAFSGIETEIVKGAERLEVAPDLVVPVARLSHLLAMKILAGRHRDLADIDTLLGYATPNEVSEAEEAITLIVERGFGPEDRDLVSEFEKLKH